MFYCVNKKLIKQKKKLTEKMLNFICDGLTICAYNIRKLIYNDDNVIIDFYSHGEHYIYSFVWKNPPKREKLNETTNNNHSNHSNRHSPVLN